MLNVAYTIFVVYPIHMDCIETKFLLWGQYLKNWYIRKVKFGNAKNSSVFNVKFLPISQLLGSMGFKVTKLTCVRLTLALMLRNL